MQKLWTTSTIHVLSWRLSTFVHTIDEKLHTSFLSRQNTHHGDMLKFISHICDEVWVWTQVPILSGCCLQHKTGPTRGYLMLLYLKGEGAKNYTPIKDLYFQIWISVGHKKQDASTLSSTFLCAPTFGLFSTAPKASLMQECCWSAASAKQRYRSAILLTPFSAFRVGWGKSCSNIHKGQKTNIWQLPTFQC